MQDYLIGIQQAVVDEREQRRAAKKQQIDTAVAAANGARPWPLGLLSPIAIFRLAMDLGCGAGIGIYAGMVANRPPGDNSVWRTSVLSGLFGPAVVFPAAFVLLTVVVRGTRWSLWRTGRMSSRTRVGAAAALVCVAGLVVWLLGPAVVRHGIAVMAVTLMPAVLVAGVGGWACVMVHRRWQASRHWAARHAADALLIAVTGTAILLLYQRDLVGAQGAAGLLFPVAVWFSIRGWRAMNDADRFAVRAAADIAVSLMLGGSLVLLLVWLANLLHMPAAEVAVLRGVLGRAGAVIDLPWWTWAAVYLVLAGVSLAFAVWPGKLAKIIDWFTRLRVVPSVEVTRRGLAAVHIGLLVIVLIGLAGPAATAPVLRARLAARYTETLTDTLRARGELAAYQAIIREFSLTRQPLLTPLADLVAQIDAISKPSDGQHNATSTELDLARRIGELQAVTLAPRPPGVGLTNQVRYLQEDSGPCDGCAQPEHPRDQPGPDTIDHPEPDIGF